MTEKPVAKRPESAGEVERASSAPTYVPRVDIMENESEVTVVADMPGIDDKHVDIDLERDVLTVRGEYTLEAPEGYSLAYQEYESGHYERSFRITDEIDRDAIEASVRNGVLRVRLPKAQEAQPRKIAVKAG